MAALREDVEEKTQAVANLKSSKEKLSKEVTQLKEKVEQLEADSSKQDFNTSSWYH